MIRTEHPQPCPLFLGATPAWGRWSYSRGELEPFSFDVPKEQIPFSLKDCLAGENAGQLCIFFVVNEITAVTL